MNQTERKIISAIIKAALAENLTISVNDGEEVVLRRSSDEKAILDVMATTEEDYLIFHDAAGKRQGQIWLIYGNDEDVVSDHSDNPVMRRLAAAAVAY